MSFHLCVWSDFGTGPNTIKYYILELKDYLRKSTKTFSAVYCVDIYGTLSELDFMFQQKYFKHTEILIYLYITHSS